MRSETFNFGLRSDRGALRIPTGPIGGRKDSAREGSQASAEARRKFELDKAKIKRNYFGESCLETSGVEVNL
jgi:hypothetical protein